MLQSQNIAYAKSKEGILDQKRKSGVPIIPSNPETFRLFHSKQLREVKFKISKTPNPKSGEELAKFFPKLGNSSPQKNPIERSKLLKNSSMRTGDKHLHSLESPAIRSSTLTRKNSNTTVESTKVLHNFKLSRKTGNLFKLAKINEKSADVNGKEAFLKKNQAGKFGRGPFSSSAVCTKAGKINEVSKQNQDASCIVQRLLQRDDCALLVVFDGHGRKGGEVSSFLSKTLPGRHY